MSDLQDFAKKHLGVELTAQQIKLIEAWTDNKIILYPRQMGRTTADKVVREYIKRALRINN